MMVKKKLLFVEDDPLLRQVLCSDFVRRGYEVFEAGDGSQALTLIENNHFDIVISDVKMPKVDGIKLLSQIRQRNSELPVFMFITGFADMTLEEAYQKGANALFSKPFNRQALFKAVDWATLPKEEKKDDSSVRLSALRLSTDFEIQMILIDSGQAINGRMINIGLGGMFVVHDAVLPEIGSHLEFHILFHQGAPNHLNGSGIVRWTREESSKGRPQGCGIEFLEFNGNCVHEANRLIETFKPQQTIV